MVEGDEANWLPIGMHWEAPHGRHRPVQDDRTTQADCGHYWFTVLGEAMRRMAEGDEANWLLIGMQSGDLQAMRPTGYETYRL